MTDLIATLNFIRKELYQFVGPILIGLGTVSCILSLIVFTRKNLRKNPCSIYLTAYHIANFLLIYTSLIFITLSNGYNISISLYNLSACRFIIYMALIWNILPPSFLILASIDRILITSSNAGTRRRSTPRLAYITIISVTLFWVLFHSHAFFLVNILQIAPNYYSCYFNPGVYLTFTAYYSLVITVILVPVLMIVFGLWTLKNIRSMTHVRVAPILSTTGTTVASALNAVHSKDRQLFRILLIDTSIYIIFTTMLSIVLMYQQVTQYNTKTIVQGQIEIFARFVTNLTFYIPFCISCYTNLIGSKTFRNEIKNIFLCR